MSLQVWLPLNGNLDNQGLSNVVVTNYGATVNNNGKIGKCYSLDGTDDRINISNLPNPQNISVAFWMKRNATTNSRQFMFTAWGGVTCELTASNTIHCYVNGGNGACDTSNAITPDTGWFHLVYTFEDSVGGKLYIDGQLVKSTASSGSISWTTTSGNIGNYSNMYYNGCMNDFRFYDHVLSPKEVEEISKGLILHYKLDGCIFGNDNLLKGSLLLNADTTIPSGVTTTANDFNGFTSATYDNTSGTSYHELLSWNNKVTVNANEIYTVSFYAKSPVSTTLTCYFYNNTSGVVQVASSDASTGAHNTGTDGNITIQLTPAWTRYWITWTFNSTATAATKSLLFRCIAGKGEISVCGVKLEKGNTATPWTANISENGLNNNVIYDMSGYNNYGELYSYDTNGSIELTNDSPRYNIATFINSSNNTTNTASGTQYIYGHCELTNPNKMSVAFWCKPIAGYGNSTGQGQFCTTTYEIGTNAGSDYQGSAMNHRDSTVDINDAASTTQCRPSFAPTANEWHHYVITYDGQNGKVYKDGVQSSTASFSEPKILDSFIGVIIGFSKAGGVWRSNQTYYSDFRVYCTTLSEQQIKELYNTSVSIDNEGNIHAREVIEI